MASRVTANIGEYLCVHHVDSRYVTINETSDSRTFEICALDDLNILEFDRFRELSETDALLAGMPRYLQIWIAQFQNSMPFEQWCALYNA